MFYNIRAERFLEDLGSPVTFAPGEFESMLKVGRNFCLGPEENTLFAVTIARYRDCLYTLGMSHEVARKSVLDATRAALDADPSFRTTMDEAQLYEAIEKTLAAFGQEIGKQHKWLH